MSSKVAVSFECNDGKQAAPRFDVLHVVQCYFDNLLGLRGTLDTRFRAVVVQDN